MDTSKTTEYTPQQVKEMCFQYLRQASIRYQEETRKVAERLRKAGITPDDFVSYSRDLEQRNQLN